jgi:uncharacterized protein (TIGR02757 family)
LSEERLDPLIVAREYNDEYIALICALFAYGNVKAMVTFLRSLDFSLLDQDEKQIQNSLTNHYYRFQRNHDVIALFIALRRLKQEGTLETHFLNAYQADHSVIAGVYALIEAIRRHYDYQSHGYNFLVGKVTSKVKGTSALKRWMMYLRWMVRNDHNDLGLWQGVHSSDLIIPLDTHTQKVSLKLGLLTRKTYDLQAAIELTQTLQTFDYNDPVKYDFALYRLGQEKVV